MIFLPFDSKKMMTKIFEHYKVIKSDGSFDLPAAKTVLKDIIKDPEWLKVTENALTACDSYSDRHHSEAQSKVKFSKDECNVKYSTMVVCLHLYNFGVSIAFPK